MDHGKAIRWTQRATAVLVLAALAACGSPPKVAPVPPKTGVSLRIEATTEINPDFQGRPSPVVVRVYQLRSAGIFQSADFFALQNNETGILGADLLGREEFEVIPGETRALSIDADIEARHLGVVAAYRELDQARWRAVAALVPNQANPFTLRLERLAVQLSGPPPASDPASTPTAP